MHNTTEHGRRSMRRLRSAAAAWRHLVDLHADPHRRTNAAERTRYVAAHRRLVKVCDDLVEEERRAQGETSTVEPCRRRRSTSDDRGLHTNSALTFDAEEEGSGEMIRQLSALLRPWANPEVIHNAPKAIVEDLLVQERRLEERITGASSRSYREWLPPICLVVVVGVTAGLFLTLLVTASDTVPYRLENLSHSVVVGAHQMVLENQLLAIGVLAWAVGTVVLWSAFRR